MQEEKQTENKMNMEDKNIVDLLEFNYRNLHESVWNNHKVAWTVTSIFVPILFAVLGYLVREYYVLLKSQDEIGFIVVIVFILSESLLIIWLLIMRSLEHYNNVRFARLKEIENILNKKIKNKNMYLFNTDVGLEEKLNKGIIPEELKNMLKTKRFPLPRVASNVKKGDDKWMITDKKEKNIYYTVKKEDGKLNFYKTIEFSQYNLDYTEKPKDFKFSPLRIYYGICFIYTLIYSILLFFILYFFVGAIALSLSLLFLLRMLRIHEHRLGSLLFCVAIFILVFMVVWIWVPTELESTIVFGGIFLPISFYWRHKAMKRGFGKTSSRK